METAIRLRVTCGSRKVMVPCPSSASVRSLLAEVARRVGHPVAMVQTKDGFDVDAADTVGLVFRDQDEVVAMAGPSEQQGSASASFSAAPAVPVSSSSAIASASAPTASSSSSSSSTPSALASAPPSAAPVVAYTATLPAAPLRPVGSGGGGGGGSGRGACCGGSTSKGGACCRAERDAGSVTPTDSATAGAAAAECCGGQSADGDCCGGTRAKATPASAAVASAPRLQVAHGGRVQLAMEELDVPVGLSADSAAAVAAAATAAAAVAVMPSAPATLSAVGDPVPPTAPAAVVRADAARDHGVPSVWFAEPVAARVFTAHADAVRALVLCGAKYITGSWDRKVCVWDRERHTRLAEYSGHTHCVEAVAAVQDALVASAAMDWTVRLWSYPCAADTPCLGIIKHTSQVHALATLSNPPVLASADDDGFVRLLDTAALSVVAQRRAHSRPAHGLVACGSALITAGADASVQCWDTREPAASWAWRAPAAVLSVAADGTHGLAAGCGDGTLLLLDQRRPDAPLAALRSAHEGRITAVAALPGGAVVSGGRDDALVRLWAGRGPELALVRDLPGHTSCVFTLGVELAGAHVWSGGNDCTVRVWSFESAAAA